MPSERCLDLDRKQESSASSLEIGFATKLLRSLARIVGVDGGIAVLAIGLAWIFCALVKVPFTWMFFGTLLVFESVILKFVLFPAYLVALYHMLTIGKYYPKGHAYTFADLRDHVNRSFLRPSNLWAFGRAVFILLLFGTAVSNVKPLVPLVTTVLYDDLLLKLDLFVCGGVDLFAWCSDIRTPHLDMIMSVAYRFLFVAFCFSLGVLFMQSRSELRLMILCFMLVYITGIALHFVVPSVGDVYMDGRAYLYANLPLELNTRGMQVMLWEERMRLLEDPSRYYLIKPFIGVAAFPSLHCAHMASLLLIAWWCHRSALVVYGPMAVLLFASTIYFGWHYISDCVAGWMIGIAMVYLAAALLRWEARVFAGWNSKSSGGTNSIEESSDRECFVGQDEEEGLAVAASTAGDRAY